MPTSDKPLTSTQRKRAQIQTKRAYTREWRATREGVQKPEARVVDRLLVGAIARSMRTHDGHLIADVDKAIALAVGTLVDSGFGRKTTVTMVRRRLDFLKLNYGLIAHESGFKPPECPVTPTHAVPEASSTA